MHSSNHLRFWVLVLSGDWPGKKPIYIGNFAYALSAVVGVLLNNGLIAIIVLFAWRTVKAARRRLMDLAKAITSRDRWILNTIRAEFLRFAIPDDQKKMIIDGLGNAFDKGKKDWADEYLPSLVGNEKDADDILKMMQLKT
jgi:hypothetical protein